MGFDKSKLTEYVKENEALLVGKAMMPKSISTFTIQTGVKGDENLHIISGDAVLQEGSCGWNSEGSTSISERKISTGVVKVNEGLCDLDMAKTFAEWQVRYAAGQETLPFEQYISEMKVLSVAKKMEKLVWRGDKSATSATVTGLSLAEQKLIDGLLTIIDKEASAIKTSAKDSIINGIEAAIEAIPSEIYDEAVVYVGVDIYRKLLAELRNKNSFNYFPTTDASFEFLYPGTTVKVIGVAGLNGTSKCVATYPKNLYFGCDLTSDAETMKLWYSDDNQEFRLAIKFNAGVQVAFPSMVVVGTLE